MRTPLLFLALLLPCGCNRYEKKLDARRIELRDSAKACPAPTTCSEKKHGDGGHDYPVCTAEAGEPTYAEGDIVLAHEIGLDMIARVNGKKGAGYAVEFADGFPVERSLKNARRVCK